MLTNLERKLTITFKDQALLEEALVHRSLLNDEGIDRSNERLEFLGDAVLELATTEYLFEQYPDEEEGRLTSLRSALVKTGSLAHEAKRLGLGEFIRMSKGEEATGGRERPYILANTVEAVLGALYLDQGFEVCKKFVVEQICYKAEEIFTKKLDVDAKSLLQEITQERVKITPQYQLISQSGPDHNKTFVMGVYIGTFELAKGEGKSKQIAERNAARKAVDNWNELEEHYTSSVS